jgi:helix-turn-helix protein
MPCWPRRCASPSPSSTPPTEPACSRYATGRWRPRSCSSTAALLHQTDASLAEIALKIGYGTEFSFAKAFKRTFGIAPGTYRGQQLGVPGLGRDPDAAMLT